MPVGALSHRREAGVMAARRESHQPRLLVVDEHRELLLCHASGSARWDIPKGVAEAGETPRQAAAREAKEETGLDFDPASLLDIGRFAYCRARTCTFRILIERIYWSAACA